MAFDKIQDQLNEILDDIESKYVRNIMKKSYLCAHECTSQESDRFTLQNCIRRCTKPVEDVRESISTRTFDFREQLFTCGRACEDRINKLITDKTSKSEIEQLQITLENCFHQCFENTSANLAALRKNIEEDAKKIHESTQ